MDVNEKITELNAGWYNVVSAAMELDPATFVLAQGCLGLLTSDSSGLYLMSDAVPPSAAVYYDAGGTSMRSSAYRLLLGALLPETGSDLKDFLGNKYANWITYKDAWWKNNPNSTLTQEKLFEQWANQRLDPRKTAEAISAFKQSSNCMLIKALDELNAENAKQEFVSSDDKNYSLYRYSASIEEAQTAINYGSALKIKYDSSTADTTLKNTTVNGSASGFYKIFSGSASIDYEKLNTSAASSKITISGTIKKFATLPTEPINWFNSAEYLRAYNGKGNANIWDAKAGSAGKWDSFFDIEKGSLARKVSQIVLVSGYDITVTSHADYSTEDYENITASAGIEIWPFFSGNVSATHTSDFTHNEDGTLSVRHTLDEGLIQIWGVTVLDAPK